MEAMTQRDENTAAIRRLTAAVWALVIVVGLNLATSVYRAFFFASVFPIHPGSMTSSVDYEGHDPLGDFHSWPIEKQVQSASVIAFTTYKREDGKLKSIITSVPKLTPGVEFRYKVGDEYTPESRYPRENATYGEGEVMFFTGSPPLMRFSASYSEGRVAGLGDIPIQKLSEFISQEK